MHADKDDQLRAEIHWASNNDSVGPMNPLRFMIGMPFGIIGGIAGGVTGIGDAVYRTFYDPQRANELKEEFSHAMQTLYDNVAAAYLKLLDNQQEIDLDTLEILSRRLQQKLGGDGFVPEQANLAAEKLFQYDLTPISQKKKAMVEFILNSHQLQYEPKIGVDAIECIANKLKKNEAMSHQMHREAVLSLIYFMTKSSLSSESEWERGGPMRARQTLLFYAADEVK